MKSNCRIVVCALISECFFSLLFPISLFANQLVGYYWNDDYQPQFPMSIENSYDNGFIIGAQTYSRNGLFKDPPDGLIFRVDLNGNIIWKKQFGAGGEVFPYGITKTSDNCYIIAAWSYGIAGSLYAKAWLIKIDDSGNILWQRAYEDNTFATKAYEAADRNFIVVGGIMEESDEGEWKVSARIMKISFNGDLMWARTLRSNENNYIPLYGAAFVNENEFVAWGSNRLYKFSNDGTLIWMKATNEYEGEIKSVILTRKGDLIVSCHYGGSTYIQPTILCYGLDGSFKWGNILVVEDNEYDNKVYLCPFLTEENGAISVFSFFVCYKGPDGGNYSGIGRIQFNDDGKMPTAALIYQFPFGYRVDWPNSAVISEDGNMAFCFLIAFVEPWWGIKIGVIKTDDGNKLNGNCAATEEIPLVWQNCLRNSLSDVADAIDCSGVSSIDTNPYNYFFETAMKSVNTFCPVITQVNKLQNPFRLEILGYNFVRPCTGANYGLQVFIDENPIPNWTSKGFDRIIAKKGDALKKMTPKGVPVCIRIGATDRQGREHPLYKCDCFYFTR